MISPAVIAGHLVLRFVTAIIIIIISILLKNEYKCASLSNIVS